MARTSTLEPEPSQHETASLRVRGRRDFADGDVDRGVKAYRGLGRIYEEQGHDRKAAAIFLSLLEHCPDDLDALRRLAAAYTRLGRNSEAARYLERLTRIYEDKGTAGQRPAWCDAYRQLGGFYLDRGKNSQAVAKLQLALRCNRSDEPSLELLIRALRFEGRLQDAARAAEVLSKLRSKHRAARPRPLLSNIGTAYAPVRDERSAEEIRRSPSHTGMRLVCGEPSAPPLGPDEHETDVATPHPPSEPLSAIIVPLPDPNPTASERLCRGLVLRGLGHTEEAMVELRLCAATPAFAAVASASLAYCMMDVGRLAEAAEAFVDACADHPSSARKLILEQVARAAADRANEE